MGMLFSQLINVLAETELSPEQLAPSLGISSMTIRRWKEESGSKKVPKSYERSIMEGIYELITDGHLSSESEAVIEIVQSSTSLSFRAVLKSLGVEDTISDSQSSHEDKVSVALFQIGSNEKRKKEVDASKTKLLSYKKLGVEWSRRISILMDVIRSELSALDKLIAYGALFYLICPFDLIPDHIPVFGLVDDFGILGFAVAYYLRKFPKLFLKSMDNSDADLPTPAKA